MLIDQTIKDQTKQQNVFIKAILALFMTVNLALGTIYLFFEQVLDLFLSTYLNNLSIFSLRNVRKNGDVVKLFF